MIAVAKIPLRQVDNVQQLLMNDQARGQLAAVAAKHMSPERLMRVTANAIRTTPKLQNCQPLSFLGALMQCAALGLEPNTVLGHAYLIPFDNSRKIDGKWVKVPEVQLIVGYKGLIDLARRSGHITSISANIHYDDDELWAYEEGTEAKLRHIPGAQDGKPLHAYAIAKFVEGGHAYVVLPWSRVMKIRDGSSGWQAAVKYGKTEKSPWFTHEEAMAKKTAIRALSKYLPLSVEFQDAVQIDNDGGSRVDYAKFALKPEEGAIIEGEVLTDDETDTPDNDGLGDKPDDETDNSEPKEDDKTPKKSTNSDKPNPKGKSAASKNHQITYSHVTGDMTDGAPMDATLEFHKDALAKMLAEDPDLHAKLMAEIGA